MVLIIPSAHCEFPSAVSAHILSIAGNHKRKLTKIPSTANFAITRHPLPQGKTCFGILLEPATDSRLTHQCRFTVGRDCILKWSNPHEIFEFLECNFVVYSQCPRTQQFFLLCCAVISSVINTLSMEVALTIIAALLAVSNAQDIAYPSEDDGSPGKQPPRLSDNIAPINVPGRCPPNEVPYPGDQNHNWTCDCGPGFIYYPTKDGCFKAYRQEPCDAHKHLILPKDKVIPECVDNPCRKDGFVQYKGKCYELGKTGEPCKPASEGGGVFGVNTTTLALECLSLDNPDRLSLINFPPNCPPGSRRSAKHCRELY